MSTTGNFSHIPRKPEEFITNETRKENGCMYKILRISVYIDTTTYDDDAKETDN